MSSVLLIAAATGVLTFTCQVHETVAPPGQAPQARMTIVRVDRAHRTVCYDACTFSAPLPAGRARAGQIRTMSIDMPGNHQRQDVDPVTGAYHSDVRGDRGEVIANTVGRCSIQHGGTMPASLL